MTATLPHNKVCSLEDFSQPELRGWIRDIFRHEIARFTPDFPSGVEYRKHWEIAMSVRSLSELGALREDARILGVGAGCEVTLFYLSHFVREVVATDLYAAPGTWAQSAPNFMLREPERAAPYEFRRDRLRVLDMSALQLEFNDASFDGIFSSGSIEHFGSMENIARAAREMARVLKPGGVLTLSTEYRIRGPLFRNGWDGMRFLSARDLHRYIIEASGLEIVGALNTTLTQTTSASVWPIESYEEDRKRQIPADSRYPMVNEVIWSHYPHLVLDLGRYRFTSVHLALTKPMGGERRSAAR